MNNKRQSVRTPLKTRIRVYGGEFGELVAKTINVSDHGVFIELGENVEIPPIGTLLEGQVLGLPGGEAPVIPMKIVRIEGTGIGLIFV